MKTLLSITLPTAGLRAPLRWSPVVVVGSLLAACGDDNQLPFATVDTLPTTKIMTEKSRQEYYVDEYFRDPDGDFLSLTASIDDATVATAVLEDLEDSLRLVVEGVAGGETMVTLTATDPHGGEAKVAGEVLVFEPVLFWRDDFDGTDVIWSFGFGSYHSFGDSAGYLTGYNRFGYHLFSGKRRIPDNAMDWLVSMSVAVEEGSTNQTVGIGSKPRSASADCDGAGVLWGFIGEGIIGEFGASNWEIRYDNCGNEIVVSGKSDGVAPVGEFSEMHLGVRIGKMELFVGGTLVFSQEVAGDPVENDWPLVHWVTELVGFARRGESDQRLYFDWAELWGIPFGEREADLSGDWQLQEGAAALKAMPLAGVMSQETDLIAQ